MSDEITATFKKFSQPSVSTTNPVTSGGATDKQKLLIKKLCGDYKILVPPFIDSPEFTIQYANIFVKGLLFYHHRT